MGNCAGRDANDDLDTADCGWLQLTFSSPSTLQFANDSVPLKFTEEMNHTRNPFCRRPLDVQEKAIVNPMPSLRSGLRKKRVLRSGAAPHHSFHFPLSPLGQDVAAKPIAIDFPPAPYESFPLEDAPATIVGRIRGNEEANIVVNPNCDTHPALIS